MFKLSHTQVNEGWGWSLINEAQLQRGLGTFCIVDDKRALLALIDSPRLIKLRSHLSVVILTQH